MPRRWPSWTTTAPSPCSRPISPALSGRSSKPPKVWTRPRSQFARRPLGNNLDRSAPSKEKTRQDPSEHLSPPLYRQAVEKRENDMHKSLVTAVTLAFVGQ